MNENERLREFRQSLNLSQAEVAKMLGMKQGSYSSIEIGRNNASSRVKKLLSTIYKLNINWLETGEGYMFLDFHSLPGRIQFIMNEWNHTPRDFAYTSGIPEPKVLSLLKGEYQPTSYEISQISAKYQRYSTQWILNGAGDVYDNRIIHANNSLIQMGGESTRNQATNFNTSDNEVKTLTIELEACKRENALLKEMIEMYRNKQ